MSVEEPAPELIALADGGAPDNNARQLTPPLNPAPRTTRAPSVGMEATRQLQEEENHDDMPAKVDHANEDDQVDDLA